MNVSVPYYDPVLYKIHRRSLPPIPLAPAAPINKLPPELLTEIFLWFSIVANDISRRGESPWTLTHICRLWRELSLKIPSLWSDFSYTKSTKSPLPLFRTQLIRSKREPLSFHVDFSCDALIPVEVLLMDTIDLSVFDLLLAESDRWEDVTLMVPGDALRVFLNMLICVQDDCHLLRAFTLEERSMKRLYNPRPLDMPDSMFATAPGLRTLKMFPFIDIAPPWSQITVFETSRLSVNEESMIIRNAPLLRKLKTHSGRVDRHSTLPEARPFTQTSLVYFVSTFTSNLLNLTLPSLTHFICGSYVPEDEVDALLDFVRRSNPPLRFFSVMLDLEPLSLSDDFIRRLADALHPVQTLVVLKLMLCFSMSEHTFASVFHALQKLPLCFPMLKKISIMAEWGICSLEDILLFIQWLWERIKGGTLPRLKKLTVGCSGLMRMNREDTFSYLEWLRGFRSKGLELILVVNGMVFDWQSYVVGPPSYDTQ
ncbi:hypothetical protein ARMSODRAFT_1089368 [Armillaria solidipes]|uniref:Uncharacterized protein n=1 Tax=Armillaria solidipes TaxID=1076256 RepID=A0A2H3AZJ4_9AGAR|nr:hypothetical protein ARMSODRAFT_1089368 [Armillaria solidipes]